MFDCTCVQRCKITASYGRKFVETMARPSACAMAQRVISSGDRDRNSALHLVICAAVMNSLAFESVGGRRYLRGFVQENPVAPISETFARVPFLRVARKHGAKFVHDVRVFH